MERSGIRVAVSQDETLACLIEARQVSVFLLPAVRAVAEVGIDEGSQACLIGAPTRLVVLTPSGTLYVVNPTGTEGPVEVASFTVAPASAILTSAGAFALINSSTGLMVLDCSSLPTLSRFPARAVDVELARPFGADRFLVQTGGVLEEWSGATRSPLRRFRLDRPFNAMQMGGGSRFLWFIARDAPTQIVVVPLTSASPPVKIDLQEPVVTVAHDSSGLQLGIVGESGALLLVSLMSRTVTTLVAADTKAAAWRGSSEILQATSASLQLIPVVKPTGDAPLAKPTELPLMQTTSQQLAAWKKKVQQAKQTLPVPDTALPNIATMTVTIDSLDRIIPQYQWRDAVASWTRALLGGARREPPLLAACALHDVATRLGIGIENREFLWLLYGARLCGQSGVAPADLVEVSPNRWDDALGRSLLKSSGVFEWHADNRVHLAIEVIAALDELGPMFGTELASGAAPNLRIATIASDPSDVAALASLGAWIAPIVGSVLIANERGLAQPDRYLREAAVRGLAPLVPSAWLDVRPIPSAPAVIIVPDAGVARQLGLDVIPAFSDNPARTLA